MKKLVPKEKMSKKTRRMLDEKRRRLWAISPLTRKIENKKHYQRKHTTNEA